MIEKLRKKFIFLSMGTMSTVVFTIIFGINIIGYERVKEKNDIILDILWDNQGHFPKIVENMSPETKYRSRYFSVLSDQDGKYMKIDTVNIAAKTRAEVAEYAFYILKEKKARGFIDHYRYIKGSKGDNQFIVFLDCSQDLETFSSFMRLSLIITIFGLLIIFLIILFYSEKIIAPVIESHKKQKRFITDVSHELKTPLSIINTNVDLIEMLGEENEWTKSIHNQVNRLNDMVSSMTELAKLEEDMETSKKEFDISKLALESINIFLNLFRKKRIKINYQIDQSIYFYGIENSIKRLFDIILENSLKYSTENENIYFSLKEKDKKIIIILKNKANGIQRGNFDYVFERFFRMDESRNSGKKGYGIGLSTAKSIVEAHKGEISAYSEDGENFIIKIIF